MADKNKLLLPLSSLDKLRCNLCNCYLSYYPIFLSTDLKNICGRCSKAANQNYVRNEAYEIAMEFVQFPCCNDKHNCMELITPKDVPHHERICTFRRARCPLKHSRKCNWEGSIGDIQMHYEELHKDLLMLDHEFEINFIDFYDDCYCLLYGEEPFLFRRKANGDTKVLECYVKYIGTQSFEENFFYQIKLENRHNDTTKEYERLPAVSIKSNVTQIRGNEIIIEMNNPTIIIGSIEIISQEKEILDKKFNLVPGNPENVNFDMLSQLECPVCFLYLMPPIYQCQGGHSICASCKQNVKECPTCKKSIEETRNFTLESMISSLIYPCKNMDSGCSFSTQSKKIREHEKNCEYGTTTCPLLSYVGCSDKQFLVSNVYKHIEDEHADWCLEIDVINIQLVDLEKNQEDFNVIKYFEKLFLVSFFLENNEYSFSVQLIGPPEMSKDFCYEIDIIDNSNKGNKRLFTRGQCFPLIPLDDCHQGEHYFCFSNFQIEPFLDERLLSFRVRIIRV